MAKQIIIDEIIKVFSRLGGNVGDVLGTRSNINFLGVGKNTEPFLDQRLNTEALGVLSQSKAIDEAKGAVGFAVSDKLNDIQAGNLLQNLKKMEEFYLPPVSPANITDLGTGTRNLDAEGLASLRINPKIKSEEIDSMIDLPEGVDPRETILPFYPGAFKGDPKDLVKNLPFTGKEIDPNDFKKLVQNMDLPPPGSRGGPEDIAAPFQSADETIANLEKQDSGLAAQFKLMTSNKGEIPAKRSSSREFLLEALKKENPNQTTFADIISAEDVKFITEGGGGLAGDPIVLVEKYFGPRIAEMVPPGATSEEILIFTNRVLNEVVDANGLRPTDPRFDRFTARFVDEVQDFAKGGLAKILEV